MSVFYVVVTWALLGIFASFLTYGIAAAVYALIRFYRAEFAKLAGFRIVDLPK